MKRNIVVWISLLFALPVISGLYGALHDQITYSISPEYFTNFKFIQFKIPEGLRDSERLAAALVGFLATWWVGIPLAIILGSIGFRRLDVLDYKRLKIRSVKTIFAVALIFGFIGYFVGLYQVSRMADWPVNVGRFNGHSEMVEAMSRIKDWDNFRIVGMIHNFSYIGAGVGLIIAVFKEIRCIRKIKRAI